MKLPTPTEGSSTTPPAKPRRCAAFHMASTTGCAVVVRPSSSVGPRRSSFVSSFSSASTRDSQPFLISPVVGCGRRTASHPQPT